ncbi:DNA-binding HxlR family transcriptional regulator [Nocardioides aromaticivorans]|jgi:DNA-binding HxlR family transcriptional regulator|uniref:DNA-binding HxlR family transcriptional regulator n=4 Tax=Nocardioides TaxID=1839 RepID=A0A7W4VY89_9ACTN|nr:MULTISPECIES: helix-turn-helix domain-containing protein [Nocardioides]MAO81248.1 transcriptional regulator [Nocardioides sp.]MBB3043991.1 DNA-binding HxlR family transcriptional regulator [Nocardioides soli]NYI47877.1 DNA-binding HxlR family transcriptional regulator [Nocardioides aromaticivorans]QSR30204.1 transcriptional regulator [Nocardioides sp. S5]GGO85296.1 HTH-type transcriptional regulator YodB [Nocardioides phosphati]|tara:strand:- start:982 stop:1341 length:360 start_codon:yes stop_codon:yes gene_type:complete
MDETQGYCPVFHRAVELIGRRWNGPIIRALLDGADRFGEIRSRIPGLTDRLLAQRLRELEREGVVERASSATTVHYTLTTKGHSLAPVIESIAQWAAAWEPPGSTSSAQGRSAADSRRR